MTEKQISAEAWIVNLLRALVADPVLGPSARQHILCLGPSTYKKDLEDHQAEDYEKSLKEIQESQRVYREENRDRNMENSRRHNEKASRAKHQAQLAQLALKLKEKLSDE